MKIQKTYQEVNPNLLFDEIKDFILKQGASPGETKFETYALPSGDTSSFISRGTLTFKIAAKECIRAHLVGSARTETKVMLDIDEKLFSPEKVKSLQEDLDFVFGSYEVE